MITDLVSVSPAQCDTCVSFVINLTGAWYLAFRVLALIAARPLSLVSCELSGGPALEDQYNSVTEYSRGTSEHHPEWTMPANSNRTLIFVVC